ncbi:unnamed protein product, partial [Sphacelaria rigidula]
VSSCVYCVYFVVVDNLSIFLHGRDRRRNCVGEWTTDLYTHMDSAGITKLYVVQILFTSYCKQRVQIVVHYLLCTLPASLISYCTKHPPPPHTHTLRHTVCIQRR